MWYARECCQCHRSWRRDGMSLPGENDKPIMKQAQVAEALTRRSRPTDGEIELPVIKPRGNVERATRPEIEEHSRCFGRRRGCQCRGQYQGGMAIDRDGESVIRGCPHERV